MPAVVLLNIGSIDGPEDGTSALCQAIDARVGPGIPGLVFVTGSSDDGGTPNHAGGTVVQGGGADITINKGNPGPLYFDLWYSRDDRFDVTIQTPDATFGPYPSPDLNTDFDNETNSEFIYYQLGGDINFYNSTSAEREISVQIDGTNGMYTIELDGALVSDGRFEASLNPARFWDSSGNQNYFTSFVVPGKTIWDLGSASNNICPNDYVHRTNWVDINGIPESDMPGRETSGNCGGARASGRLMMDGWELTSARRGTACSPLTRRILTGRHFSSI